MLSSLKSLLPVMALMALPVLGLASDNSPVVPLLPSDNGDHVTFTKQSLDAIRAQNKAKSSTLQPRLAVAPASMNHEKAVLAAVNYLVNAKKPYSAAYYEAAGPAGGGMSGWAWLDGASGSLGNTPMRSTVGEISLALLKAYERTHSSSLIATLNQIALAMRDDYFTKGGPFAASTLPFMQDIVFLKEYGGSGIQSVLAADSTNYLNVAINLFGRLLVVRPTASAEVTRIINARATQGLPEMSGYDIAWLGLAAQEIGNTTYATAVASALTALNGSWEINGTGTTNAQAQVSTGNMLSRGILNAVGMGSAGWPLFLAGTQQTTGGVINGYNSYGSFLPAGNIQAASYIILGLNGIYYKNAVRGCQYLLGTELASGAWYNYPLQTGNTDIYPNVVASALWAYCEVSYNLDFPAVKDREGNVNLSNILVMLTNEAGDTTIKATSAGTATFYALLDSNLTISFPLGVNQKASLPADKISSYDASLVLGQAIQTTPFGSSSPDYGAATGALNSANLGKGGSFTNSSVNSQIAAEILRYAVGISPQYPPIYFDLLRLVGISLAEPVKILSDRSGSMSMGTVNLVLLGDISNNFGTGGGFTGSTLLASAGSVSPFTLSLLDYVEESGNLQVPINVSGIGEGTRAPRSFQYQLTYDRNLVSFQGFRLAEGLGSFIYALNSSQVGLVKVAMASGQPLLANGIIGYLEFGLKNSDAKPDFGLSNVLIDERNAQGVSSVFSASLLGKADLPKAVHLSQNSPNPFNPSTTISYSIPAGSDLLKVRLEVFNLRGQLVKSLVDMLQSPGDYVVSWEGHDMNGQSVPSGVYFYRIQAGSYTQVRKMIILK